MSGELLFELIEKAQWSFERKIRSNENDRSWSFNSIFKKWFCSSIKISPNAERFLKENGDKPSKISLHIPSNRLALILNNTICIISVITSEVLIEISFDLPQSDEFNYLNCLNWSDNGKFLAIGHWSGIVSVYSSYDGQLLHELTKKSLNYNEDSFIEIWFSGSDASQFIDLLCLKRNGQLNRYVMSRNDIASCAEYKFDFNISYSLIDSNQNQIYIVPFNCKSILLFKIIDTNPYVIQIKQIIYEDKTNFNSIYRIILSPNKSYLVSLLTDQSIILYKNDENFQFLSKVKINENRSFISDLNYWDNKTLILIYSDGSMSFHEGNETLEEYRYELNQLNKWSSFTNDQSNNLYIIDFKINKINNNDNDEDNLNIIYRLFNSFKISNELINQRLILIEHIDPCRFIEHLILNDDFGEALRICKLFNRYDLSDKIHEKALRLSSSQIETHLTRIQSRLHVLQLCTTILYSTFNEQYDLIKFGLDKATNKKLFNNLFYSEDYFFQTIYNENEYLKDVQPLNIQLNISQKQILIYRKKLLDEKRKLFLYDDLINKYKIFNKYQSNIYQIFRLSDYKHIALKLAREGHINGLRLVIDRSNPSLTINDLLIILDNIPETISLLEYEDLIPKINSLIINNFNENDWIDQFNFEFNSEFNSNFNKDFDENILIQWFRKKINSFESFGFIENALQLSKFAFDLFNLNDFSLLNKYIFIEYLLNKICEQELTLKQIENMSQLNIIDLILTFKSNINQDDINKRIEQVLLPLMNLFDNFYQNILFILIEKLKINIDIYPIINSFKLKNIFNDSLFDQLIKQIILNINSINHLSICQQLLDLINDKQNFQQILQSCQIFQKWSLPMIPSEIIRIFESEESLSNSIEHLIQSAIKQETNKINISIGNELYHDIEQITQNHLSSQTLSNLFISSLLKSESIESFQIVRTMLLRVHIPLIIQAANDYIDSAKNGQDKSIILAKHCLDLIDDQSLIIYQKNLIESQLICDYFHYLITPIEIRHHPNPIQIISSILNSNPQAYKNTSKLISLSLYLNNEKSLHYKEQSMLFIAEYSLKINDLNMCWELCSSLIDDNYGPSWKCAWNLINKSQIYINEKILSFISLHCDYFILNYILNKSIFMRNQSIEDEEYKITSTYSYYINSFYDRNYLQQIDLKEIPLLKSPPINEKYSLKYVNIDTPLFIIVYLSSNTINDILIEKDNEYALELSIYCQTLINCKTKRNLNIIPSKFIENNFNENNENYKRLIDNRQYSILNKLDKTIDLKRFQDDNEYRRLTIIGLFMCDSPSFDYIEQLAIKYNISIDECHLSYLEYLLTNNYLSINDIRKRIKPYLNSERIKKNQKIKLDFVKRLHTNVFPLIDGKDYERLKLFYDIKKSLGDLTHAQKHIQTIQQLISILNQDFDYKLLISSYENFIEKYSNDSNIIDIGLILDQIKISSSLILNSSLIYSFYLKINPNSLKLFDLLNRIILFDEFNKLIKYLLLSLKNILSINKRIQIIKYSIDLINSKNDSLWKTLQNFLQDNLFHLEILNKYSDEYSFNELNKLDQTDNIQQQQFILSDILFNHQKFDFILYLKNTIFTKISIYEILQITIEKFSENIKLTNENHSNLLNNLFENLSMDNIDKNQLFSCLQKLSRSEFIDRRIRYQLIDKLDKMFDKQNLESDDLLLFEQYRLSTLLSSFDSFNELKKQDIENDEKRCELFQKYLLESRKLIHYESLIQILNNIWSKQQIDNMKGSHGLSIKNEFILSMIENKFEWKRIFTDKTIQFYEDEIISLIKYLYNSKDFKSYSYKLWLINPISSLNDQLFQSISELVIDEEFILMSIENNRVNDLLSINPSLFDYYLNKNLSYETKEKILNQIENNEEFLLKVSQLFIHKENYLSFISFGLVMDTLHRYFLNK